MKKSSKAKFPNSTVVQNCTFHTTPMLDSVALARAEAVKAIAQALGKAADALGAGPSDVAGLKITNP